VSWKKKKNLPYAFFVLVISLSSSVGIFPYLIKSVNLAFRKSSYLSTDIFIPASGQTEYFVLSAIRAALSLHFWCNSSSFSFVKGIEYFGSLRPAVTTS